MGPQGRSVAGVANWDQVRPPEADGQWHAHGQRRRTGSKSPIARAHQASATPGQVVLLDHRWTENGRWHRGVGVVDWSGSSRGLHAIEPNRADIISKF